MLRQVDPAFFEEPVELQANIVGLVDFHDHLAGVGDQFACRIDELTPEDVGIDRHRNDRFGHVILNGLCEGVFPSSTLTLKIFLWIYCVISVQVELVNC